MRLAIFFRIIATLLNLGIPSNLQFPGLHSLVDIGIVNITFKTVSKGRTRAVNQLAEVTRFSIFRLFYFMMVTTPFPHFVLDNNSKEYFVTYFLYALILHSGSLSLAVPNFSFKTLMRPTERFILVKKHDICPRPHGKGVPFMMQKTFISTLI